MLSSKLHNSKWPKNSQRRACRFHVARTLALLLVLTIQKGCIQAKKECPALGCSLTAVDIMYDESTKEALSILRTTEAKESLDSDEQPRVKALSALQPAGDESRTTLTLRGYKGGNLEDQINQDRAIVVSPFMVSSGDGSSKSDPEVEAQLLGVFDGHGGGGEKTSQYAVEQVPSLLAAKLASLVEENANIGDIESQVVESLKQTFDEVDKKDPSNGNAGCTATVVLRLGQKLFVANAGDSVSFVGVYFGKKIQIMYRSREDKPDLPEERTRIQAAGGYVHLPTDNGDVPRAYYIDENRQARYGLAMSRSLGDWKVQGVIAEPIVDVLDLQEIVKEALASYAEFCGNDVEDNDNNRYCENLDSSDAHVFAASISDGMMDYLGPEDVGRVLATAFFDEDSGLHPHSAAEQLILDAAKGWNNDFRGEYRDDIAIASFVVPFS